MQKLPLPVKILRAGLAIDTSVGCLLTTLAARRWMDATLGLFCVFIAASVFNAGLFVLSIPKEGVSKRVPKKTDGLVPVAAVIDTLLAVVFLVLHIVNVINADHWRNRSEVLAMYAAFVALVAR
jgi:hypothetical protein